MIGKAKTDTTAKCLKATVRLNQWTETKHRVRIAEIIVIVQNVLNAKSVLSVPNDHSALNGQNVLNGQNAPNAKNAPRVHRAVIGTVAAMPTATWPRLRGQRH
jgi:hypothetical protein